MQRIIERHHTISGAIEKIPRKKHQKIHGNVPIDTLLSKKMRHYDAITKLVVIMKNWTKGYEKDFGQPPNIGLVYAVENKKQLIKEIRKMVKEELKKVNHIKGLGPRYLAGILAYAHPNRFSSLRKFLFYCGYTEASNKLKHYNRRIKPIVYQTVKSLIMHKDEKYYPLYLKFKQDLGNHYKAINRVGTYLLKELYQIFYGQKTERSFVCIHL